MNLVKTNTYTWYDDKISYTLLFGYGHEWEVRVKTPNVAFLNFLETDEEAVEFAETMKGLECTVTLPDGGKHE